VKRSRLYPVRSLRKLEYILGVGRDQLRDASEWRDGSYHPFDIGKLDARGSVKWRHIDNPDKPLKSIQSRINSRLLSTLELPPGMMGAVKGKSIGTNAALHSGKRVVVTLDLKACFDSIGEDRVGKALERYFGCGKETLPLLLRLVMLDNRLPQGAPSSPSLANICLLPLYSDLQNLADREGLALSSWIDDFAFSGAGAGSCIEEAIRIIYRHGFKVSPRKVKLMSRRGRQSLTGTTVNAGPSVGRPRIEAIRHRIHVLSAEPSPADSDLRTVRGQICAVKSASISQWTTLHNLAERSLPATGRLGDGPSKRLTRPCHGKMFHSNT